MTNIIDRIIQMKVNLIQPINDDIAGWGGNNHQFSPEQVGAIQAAWLAGRPLLVRGDPGLGKSQMAAALACFINFKFNSITIHADTEIADLLYRVDHVARLSDAQQTEDSKPLSTYIDEGILWQTLAPKTKATDLPTIQNAEQTDSYNGSLLLIDEIDKADSSLPNALLEVLANKTINVMPLNQKLTQESDHSVFVIITSNDERELPAAFLRRCAILDLTLEEGAIGEKQLTDIYLAQQVAINNLANGAGFVVTNDEIVPSKVAAIAKLVIDNRAKQKEQHDYLSGTSEFLDLLRALVQFPVGEQRDNLQAILLNTLVKKSNKTG